MPVHSNCLRSAFERVLNTDDRMNIEFIPLKILIKMIRSKIKLTILQVREYIQSNNSLPFVITGVSGCGKTSLMAILHQMVIYFI